MEDEFDVFCYPREGDCGYIGSWFYERDANQVADNHEDWHDDND